MRRVFVLASHEGSAEPRIEQNIRSRARSRSATMTEMTVGNSASTFDTTLAADIRVMPLG
jgi:hypothetical protein